MRNPFLHMLPRGISLFVVLAWAVAPALAQAALVPSGELIKGSGPAVYYFHGGKRYVFMNEQAYFNWYRNFDDVHLISDAGLASLPLGGNVTYMPGTLVKLATDPKVYVVESPHTLHWVTTEQIARDEFGADWNTQIKNLSDAQFTDYDLGEPVTGPLNRLGSSYLIGSFAQVLSAEMPPEETPPIKAFLHPEPLAVLLLSPNGYVATSTQSVSALKDWFISQSSGWSLTYAYVTSTVSPTASGSKTKDLAMMDFTQSRGDRQAHRSLFLARTESDDPSDAAEGTQLMFQEGELPAGYPFYPLATAIFIGEQNGAMGHFAVSHHSIADVSQWYRTTLAADGWTLSDVPPGEGGSSLLKDVPQEHVRAEHAGRQRVLEYQILDIGAFLSSLFSSIPSATTSGFSFTFISQTWLPGVE